MPNLKTLYTSPWQDMGEGSLDGLREEVITHLPPQSSQLMASSLPLTSIGFVCFGEEKVLGYLCS